LNDILVGSVGVMYVEKYEDKREIDTDNLD